MRFLKQSTAHTITVGPAVDKTDGFTPQVGLTAATVDEIGVYKHGGTALVDLSGTTTLTHRAGGVYTMTLSTDDTATLGHLIVYIRDDSVCRPIFMEFMVVPANVYDSLFGSDKLQVDAREMDGTDLEAKVGANFNTLFQNAGETSTKTLDAFVPGFIWIRS